MPIRIGDKNISKVMYGDKEISKIYLGSKLIFPTMPTFTYNIPTNITVNTSTIKLSAPSGSQTDNSTETDELITKTQYWSSNQIDITVYKTELKAVFVYQGKTTFELTNVGEVKQTVGSYNIYFGLSKQDDGIYYVTITFKLASTDTSP